MTERDGADDQMTGALSLPLRAPAKRLGVVVVEALVDLIVSGELEPGDTLPPEQPLGQQFGVSRTVLRESIKKLEEKGLVTVSQGRGTVVQPTRSWNMLDRVVLEALIAHDRSLGVLDEITVVRAQLESAMARESSRYSVDVPATFHERTLREHEQVFAAIEAGSADEAASTMLGHIVDAWTRRRPADHRGTKAAK
jgi:DNA-binding FadR family transcriptional regulator